MKDLSYETIDTVLRSWEAAKQLSCWEEQVGLATLRR